MINNTELKIATHANQYRLTKLQRETIEDQLRIQQAALTAIIEDVKALLADVVVEVWEHTESEQQRLLGELEEAKKNETTNKTLLSDLAYKAALETGQRGRTLHPSINIQSTDEVRLPDDLAQRRYLAGWMMAHEEQYDNVIFKIKDINWWRKEAQYARLPEGVSLVEVPLIRIDSRWEE